MTLCMTLSGHTSTLPRLVVQGHGFEASYLRWAKLDFSDQSGCILTEAMISTNKVSAFVNDTMGIDFGMRPQPRKTRACHIKANSLVASGKHPAVGLHTVRTNRPFLVDTNPDNCAGSVGVGLRTEHRTEIGWRK